MTRGVESGLGGVFRTTSDILGEGGTMMSGDDVLVSATDSPRSGQRHCLEAKFADGCLLYGINSSTNDGWYRLKEWFGPLVQIVYWKIHSFLLCEA